MKICLCGSTRFKREWQAANERLTRAGHVVYSVAVMSHADGVELDADTKETLDLVHLRKVEESDAVVLVTDSSGYYGDSTRRELKWASIKGIPVYRDPRLVPDAVDPEVNVPSESYDPRNTVGRLAGVER